jgi:small subunit ribosomal protein S17
MADEKTPENETPETETDAPEAAAAEETPAAAADEAPEAPAAEAPESPPDDTPETVEEAVETADPSTPGDVEAVEVDSDETVPGAGPEAPSAPEQQLSPKERRSRRRVAQAAKRGDGPKTPEERRAARDERRRALAAQRRRYRARTKEKRAATRTEQPAGDELHAPEHGPGRPKVREGVVVSDKTEKTIVVRIDVVRRHRRYQKILRSTTTLHAHDERNDAHEGDKVRVVESRPMSRTKRWRLVDVLERAK